MLSTFEWTMAWRTTLRTPREGRLTSVTTGFSIMGVVVGVAALVVVMAIMNGFRVEVARRIVAFNGRIVAVSRDHAPFDDYAALTAMVQRVPGISAAVPALEAGAMAVAGKSTQGVLVKALRLTDLQQRTALTRAIIGGDLSSLGDGDAIVIGSRLAEALGVGIGARMSLIAPRGEITVFGAVPRVKRYTVIAIYELGLYDYDNTYVFLPLSAAQLFFKSRGRVSHLEITPDDSANVKGLLAQLGRSPADHRLLFYDWLSLNVGLFQDLDTQHDVMFLVLSLIVVASAFNIISGLTLLVRGKRGDIAILRTMGASQGAIMRVYLLVGTTIGMAGSVVGSVIGVAIASHAEVLCDVLQSVLGIELFNPKFYYLSELPSVVDAVEVAQIVAMAVSASVLATLYPAFKAARVDPVEALRHG